MKNISWLLVILVVLSCKEEEKKEKYTIPSHENSSVKDKETTAEGKKIYQQLCAQCHLPTGKGIPNMYPPLANSNWLSEKRTESIRAVKYGLSGKIEVNGKSYDNIMTPMDLSDEEIVEVMNYVMTSWGNQQKDKVTLEEVKAVEK